MLILPHHSRTQSELITSLLLRAPAATERPKRKSAGIKLYALILFYPISTVLKYAGEFKNDSNYTLEDFLALGKKIEFLTDGAQIFSQLYLCDLHMLVMQRRGLQSLQGTFNFKMDGKYPFTNKSSIAVLQRKKAQGI